VPDVVRRRPLEELFDVPREDEPPDVGRLERDASPPFLATAFFVVSLADAKPLFDVDLLAEPRPDDVPLRDDVPLLLVEPLLELADPPRLEAELPDDPFEEPLLDLDEELPLPPELFEELLRVDEVPFEELLPRLEAALFEGVLPRPDNDPLLAVRPPDELLEVPPLYAVPFFFWPFGGDSPFS